jgi:hypothetical protein
MSITLSQAERGLFGETLEAILRDNEGTDATPALLEFGVAEIFAADRASLTPLAFELQGRHASTSSLLSVLMTTALEDALPGCGGIPVAVPVAGDSSATGINGELVVEGIVSAPADSRRMIAGSTSEGVVIVDLPDDPSAVRTIEGIDPTAGLRAVRASCLNVQNVVAGEAGSDAWTEAIMWARIALAAELVGCGRAALAAASEHAASRVQFKQPIGAFQAVKHRLAEALVALEGAAATVTAASARPTALSAMVAKSAAGRAAKVTSTNALQVLGAVGFTLEHPFHRFQRRSIALDHLLGSCEVLPRRIGAVLRDRRDVPPIILLEDTP